MSKKGIFCLEGLWEDDLRKKDTVAPILELLEKREKIPYIHRDCAIREEFSFYISKWTQKKYQDYPILYLAFHGSERNIYFSNGKCSLDEISDLLAEKCKKSIIIIASCSVMKVDKRILKGFLKKTGALAICGYACDVGWMRATAFELLLFSIIQENVFDGRGIGKIKENSKTLSETFKDLNFRMVTTKET
jgi:hypothetical protein